MLLSSQKYGCHLQSQLQQFYGPSCNIFKMFVASASHLEDFLHAFQVQHEQRPIFLLSAQFVSCQSYLYGYDAVVFSLVTKFVVIVVLRTSTGKIYTCNTVSLKTDSIPKLRHTVTSMNTETHIYHQKPDDS
jgi:hypothetical protein